MSPEDIKHVKAIIKRVGDSFSLPNDNLINLVPFLMVMYKEHLNINPMDTTWLNRDRIIITNQKKSATLAVLQSMAGYRNQNIFYSVDILTEAKENVIETSVGISLAENYLESKWKAKYENSLINFYTYLIIDRFSLLNYKTLEFLRLCAARKLNKLIIIYYSGSENDYENEEHENLQKSVMNIFNTLDYFVQLIDDSNNPDEINEKILIAKECLDKPSFIYLNITKDNQEILPSVKPSTTLAINDKVFDISEELLNAFRNSIRNRFQDNYISWMNKKNDMDFENMAFDVVLPENITNLVKINDQIISNISFENVFVMDHKYFDKINLDRLDSQILNHLIVGASLLPLKCIVKFPIKTLDLIISSIRKSASYVNKNTFILNYNFFNQSNLDYINMLNSIKTISVFKPFNKEELKAVWEFSLNLPKTSCILIPDVNTYENYVAMPINISNGAYVIYEELRPDVVLLSSGSDLFVALKVREILKEKNISTQVVSVPCLDLFLNSTVTYQTLIAPPSAKKLILESSPSNLWYKYIYHEKYIIDVSKYQITDKKKTNVTDYYDINTIVNKIIETLDKR